MPPEEYNRLDSKLDTVLAQIGGIGVDVATLKADYRNMSENVGKLASHVDTQNGRVRKLELWRSWVVGAAFVIGIIGKVMFDLFTR